MGLDRRQGVVLFEPENAEQGIDLLFVTVNDGNGIIVPECIQNVFAFDAGQGLHPACGISSRAL